MVGGLPPLPEICITWLSDARHAEEMFRELASNNPFRLRGPMYSRTQNENGSYNTRCLHCFLTVASAVETEEQLTSLEHRHICPEMVLADLLDRERSTQLKIQRN